MRTNKLPARFFDGFGTVAVQNPSLFTTPRTGQLQPLVAPHAEQT